MRTLLIAAALSGMTVADSKHLDRALAGRVAGRPVSCVSDNQIETPQIVNDQILLYRDGGRIWRNDLPAACPGLDDDALVVMEVHGGQLCRNDTFYTLQRGGIGIPGPRCRLGNFTPWTKPKR